MTDPLATQRRALQIAIAIAACVPVAAGLNGIAEALGLIGQPHTITHDSHDAYLSGLLLGIGLAFWTSVPRIESHAARIRLLTAIVVVGGIARLVALFVRGVPDAPMLFGLGMELVVTPLLCLWQARVAAHAAS